MDEREKTGPKRTLRQPMPTMDELRARFGRALRDQNFWSLMDQLEGEAPPAETPPQVVPFPTERAVGAPAPADERPGRVIAGRFPRK